MIFLQGGPKFEVTPLDWANCSIQEYSICEIKFTRIKAILLSRQTQVTEFAKFCVQKVQR